MGFRKTAFEKCTLLKGDPSHEPDIYQEKKLPSQRGEKSGRFCSVLGFLWFTAEASLAVLASSMKSITSVRRDGEAKEVEVGQVVPGDVVLMEAGDVVLADGRLFVTANIEIEEAALTGESVASPKDTETITNL
jgi:hypothetical protein